MRQFIRANIKTIEWTLAAFVVLVALVSWGAVVRIDSLTLYDVFPPLGIAAFGLMWVHYIIGAMGRYAGIHGTRQNTAFQSVSMGIVLALIVLHPGIFWLALYLDGFGLPPQSYMEVYAAQIGLVSLGTLGLLIFLAFELRRFFNDRPWWRVIELLQIVGMGAIFIHGFGLGSQVTLPWVSVIWLTYGVSLAGAIVYSYVLYNEKEKIHAK